MGCAGAAAGTAASRSSFIGTSLARRRGFAAAHIVRDRVGSGGHARRRLDAPPVHAETLNFVAADDVARSGVRADGAAGQVDAAAQQVRLLEGIIAARDLAVAR